MGTVAESGLGRRQLARAGLGKETAQHSAAASRGTPGSEGNQAPSLSRDHRTTQKTLDTAAPLAAVLQRRAAGFAKEATLCAPRERRTS